MASFKTVHTSYHSNRVDDAGNRGTTLYQGVRDHRRRERGRLRAGREHRQGFERHLSNRLERLFSSTGSKLALPPGGVDSGWTNDGPHSIPETTTFTTRSKDTLDLPGSGWQCTGTNNLTPKDDILHAYSFAFRPTSGPRMGHLIIYGGFERFANNGAGDLGYWLFADPNVACSTSGATTNFSGAHTVGDLLIVGEFSTGGSVTTLSVIEWVGAGPCATPAGPNLCLITTPGNADCTLASSADNICARVNVSSLSTKIF